MIVKIPIKLKNGTDVVMMFGDSYKKWFEQFKEYYQMHRAEIVSVGYAEKSDSKWIGWGGLKWCVEAAFQDNLDQEGNNLKPRQFSEMKFSRSTKADDKINEILAKYSAAPAKV